MPFWDLPTPPAERRPVRSWQTIGGGHTVTIGRLHGAWYVEHQSLDWHGLVCDSEQLARVLADRARATVPGRTWIEFEAILPER